METCLRPPCPPSASTYRCIRTSTLVPRAYRLRPAPPAPLMLPPSTTQPMSRASAPCIAQTGANLPSRPRRERADLPPDHLPGLRSCRPASATLLWPTCRRLTRCFGRSRVPGRHACVCRAALAVHASCRSMDEMLEIHQHTTEVSEKLSEPTRSPTQKFVPGPKAILGVLGFVPATDCVESPRACRSNHPSPQRHASTCWEPNPVVAAGRRSPCRSDC